MFSQDFRRNRSLCTFLFPALCIYIFSLSPFLSVLHTQTSNNTHQKSYFIKSVTLLPAALLIPFTVGSSMRKQDREGVRLIAFRQERRRILNETAGARAETPRRLKGRKGERKEELKEKQLARKRWREERQASEKRKNEVVLWAEWDSCHRWKKRIRGCKENLLRGEGKIEDPRERRHRLRPCCIYHIITIIEPRTTRRHLLCSPPSTTPGADRPPLPFLLPCSVLTAATANWKLANTFSLRCSLVLLARNCLP